MPVPVAVVIPISVSFEVIAPARTGIGGYLVSSAPSCARPAGQAIAEPVLVAPLARQGEAGGHRLLLDEHLFALGLLGQARARQRAAPLDLGLQVHHRPEDLLGPGGQPGM